MVPIQWDKMHFIMPLTYIKPLKVQIMIFTYFLLPQFAEVSEYYLLSFPFCYSVSCLYFLLKLLFIKYAT